MTLSMIILSTALCQVTMLPSGWYRVEKAPNVETRQPAKWSGDIGTPGYQVEAKVPT